MADYIKNVEQTLPRPLDKNVWLKVNFLITQTKHMLWVLNETVLLSTQKQIIKLMDKKIFTNLLLFFLSRHLFACIPTEAAHVILVLII